MEKLKQLTAQAMAWLTEQGFPPEAVQLGALILSVIALLFTLVALSRSRRQIAGQTATRLTDKIEHTVVHLEDVRSRLEGDVKKLREELAHVRGKMGQLEQTIAVQSKLLAQAASESEKKKLEISPRDGDLPEEGLFTLPDEPVLVFEQPSTPPPAVEPAPITPPPLAAEPALPPARVEPAPTIPAPPAERPKTSIFSGLKKSRDFFFGKISSILSKGISEETYEELEEALISSDLGVKTTQKLLQTVRDRVRAGEIGDAESCRAALKASITEILRDSSPVEIVPAKRADGPLVILVVGVNGVGKTTTIGKLASRFSANGARVLLGAADTFRAAAGEQIEVWAERANVEVLRGAENAKPATVAYESIHKARQEGFDVVIIDTAGRLHTRVNLMNELSGVIGIIDREQPGAPHETLLIVDATTGQNALEQAKEFHQRAKLSGVVVTKLDGTPKGGIVVAIKDELGVPIRYVGVGESAADLKPFSAEEFADALFADGETQSFTAAQGKSEVRAVRRRRSEETLPAQANGD